MRLGDENSGGAGRDRGIGEVQALHSAIGVDGGKYGFTGGGASSAANSAELLGRGSRRLSQTAPDAERIDPGSLQRGHFLLQEHRVRCAVLCKGRENGGNYSLDSELGHL